MKLTPSIVLLTSWIIKEIFMINSLFKMTFTSVFFIIQKYADLQGDVFEKDSVICPKILPVTMSFDDNNVIGTVKVRQNGNEYEGDFEIVSHHSIEGLNPAIQGKIIERDGNNIKKCEITNVILCVSGNSDERIKRITKEQITTIKLEP